MCPASQTGLYRLPNELHLLILQRYLAMWQEDVHGMNPGGVSWLIQRHQRQSEGKKRRRR